MNIAQLNLHGKVLPSDSAIHSACVLAYFSDQHKGNFLKIGIMECWSIGVLENKKCRKNATSPALLIK
jgi:hypothetical protein